MLITMLVYQYAKNKAMPFQKNNQYRAKSIGDKPLASKPVSFKPRSGQLEKLKTIPNWQERLRDYIDTLIKEHCD